MAKNMKAPKPIDPQSPAGRAIALKEFEEEYGEVHINVTAIVHGDVAVGSIIKELTKPPMKVPEGGKVKTNVKIERK